MDLTPGIPGDDIPFTPQEEEHFQTLSQKVPTEKTYTPPPITGYRNLSQVEVEVEVDLMNAVKAHGEATKVLILMVQAHLHQQRRATAQLPIAAFDAELQRIDKAEPDRWSRVAATHMQEGFMALTRAIAQPSTF